MLFRVLIPSDLMARYEIDPVSLTDLQGRPIARFSTSSNGHSMRLELCAAGDATDALVEMELSDTSFNQIEVVWVALQDPAAPRYDTDVMPDGQSTLRGAVRRNVTAEAAALAAGLAPGQIRKGLDMFRRLADRLEAFMLCLNQHEYIAQPLFYHTAVLFERSGFSYIQGQALMEEITHGFEPGGELTAKLDGATPFRQPAGRATVRGRSWAVHDGILSDRWDRVRMVKRVGLNAGVDTCPGIPW